MTSRNMKRRRSVRITRRSLEENGYRLEKTPNGVKVTHKGNEVKGAVVIHYSLYIDGMRVSATSSSLLKLLEA